MGFGEKESGATGMSQTLAEKIMSRLAGQNVQAWDFVELSPDWTFSLDDGIGLVDRYFKLHGVQSIASPEKIAVFYDHFSPADTPLHAHVQRVGRKLCEHYGITKLFDVGEGISHQIAVESGLVKPGQMVTNTDSHTLTIGAVGAIGCGLGVAEMAYLWTYGKLWFQIPASIKIELSGKLAPGVAPKDIVLTILRKISARGAHYASVEYHGSALRDLGIAERMTLCNMGIEMGAKFAVVPGDEVTRRHYKSLGMEIEEMPRADADAAYAAHHRFDLSEIEPMLSAPHKVDNVHPVAAYSSVRINQAFLGTCTNGRFEDFEIAANILGGRHIAPGVRMVVTPASRQVYLRALREGVIQALVEAGCSVTTPGCGACAGIHQGVLAEEEVCISSSSRNFLGRMGSRDASIYVGSPATVAASAVTGYITDPRTLARPAASPL
jgi:homoaconitate hydratase family protein